MLVFGFVCAGGALRLASQEGASHGCYPAAQSNWDYYRAVSSIRKRSASVELITPTQIHTKLLCLTYLCLSLLFISGWGAFPVFNLSTELKPSTTQLCLLEKTHKNPWEMSQKVVTKVCYCRVLLHPYLHQLRSSFIDLLIFISTCFHFLHNKHILIFRIKMPLLKHSNKNKNRYQASNLLFKISIFKMYCNICRRPRMQTNT